MATDHAEPNYNAIFVWLFVLTVLEVGVTYVPMAKAAIVFLLVAMAITKAALVAMFFMHLRFERATLGVIALTPMIICAFLLFMLMPDSDPDDRLGPQTAAQTKPVAE